MLFLVNYHAWPLVVGFSAAISAIAKAELDRTKEENLYSLDQIHEDRAEQQKKKKGKRNSGKTTTFFLSFVLLISDFLRNDCVCGK